MPKRKSKPTTETPEIVQILQALPAWVNKFVWAGGAYAFTNLDAVGREGVALIIMGAYECETCKMLKWRETDGKAPICASCRLETMAEDVKGDKPKVETPKTKAEAAPTADEGKAEEPKTDSPNASR